MLLLLLSSSRARQLWLAALILVGAALWLEQLSRYADAQANTVFAINAGIVLAARWAAARVCEAVRRRRTG